MGETEPTAAEWAFIVFLGLLSLSMFLAAWIGTLGDRQSRSWTGRIFGSGSYLEAMLRIEREAHKDELRHLRALIEMKERHLRSEIDSLRAELRTSRYRS